MSIKEELYKQCLTFIDKRLQTVQNELTGIRNALLNETKSSAGDKHETGRAMLQLEREKAGEQLLEAQKLHSVLSKIDPLKRSHVVTLGSVVYTSKNNYYIAVSAGEIRLSGTLFYAISPQTPIGSLLLFKTIGDAISFRNEDFTITKVI